MNRLHVSLESLSRHSLHITLITVISESLMMGLNVTLDSQFSPCTVITLVTVHFLTCVLGQVCLVLNFAGGDEVTLETL